LKHGWTKETIDACRLRRNDQENPPGIETSAPSGSCVWIGSRRNDQENPPGIETEFRGFPSG